MPEELAEIKELKAELQSPTYRTWRQFIKKFTFKVAKKILMLVGLLLLLLVALLQFSFFQTVLVNQVFKVISGKLGFEITQKSVAINWANSGIIFENLSIRDLQGNQMVFAGSLAVDFEYNTLIKNGDVLIKDVLLREGTFNLITDKKTGELNFTQFIDKIESLTAPEKPKVDDSTSAKVLLEKVLIEDTYFGFSNDTKPYDMYEGMDFNHFGIDKLFADLHSLMILGDTLEMQVNQLSGFENKAKLNLKNLHTFFRLTDNSMEFRNIFAQLGNSVIKDEIFFSFKNKKDLSDFNEKVTFIAYLDSTVLYTDDLAAFAPPLKQYEDVWRVSGTFRGRVNDFNVKNLDLYLGKESHFQGEAEFAGLPNFDETFMNIRFKESHMLAWELDKYINNKDVSFVLKKLGVVNFKANFVGFHSDFVADGVFQTSIGKIESDINLKLKKNQALSYYKGNIKTSELFLGELFDQPELIKTLDMEGNVEGTGFTPETAKLKLDAEISSLVFNNYNYHNIKADGELSSQRFDGELISTDENFNFEVKGEINFGKDAKNPELPTGKFDLKSIVHKISLQPLNFSPVEAIIKGNIHLDTYGLNLDSLVGEAVVSDAFVLYNNKALDVKSLDFLSFKNEKGERFFEIHSDYLDFQADGNFTFTQVANDLNELFKEYLLTFSNNPEKIEKYYQKKKEKELRKYTTQFSVEFKNMNPVLSLFTKGIYISKDATLKGTFSHSKTSLFSLYTEKNIDSVFYDNTRIYDIKLDLNTSKIANSSNVLAEGLLSSGKQVVGQASLENTSFYAVWGQNLIDFELKTKQSQSDNYADLFGTLEFLGDTLEIDFKPSLFQFLKEKWKISSDNKIYVSSEFIDINNLVLFNEENTASQISINGAISDTLDKPLLVNVQEVELLTFADFIGLDLRGVLNSSLSYSKIQGKPEIEGDFSIENLVYEKVLVGDIDGNTHLDNTQNKLDIAVELNRKGKYILDLKGSYFPAAPDNQLTLAAEFNKSDLEILEPFVKTLVSKLKGTIDGRIDISGKLTSPVLTGKLNLENGQFRLNYLNTTYNTEGEIFFRQNEIGSGNMLLFDNFSNPATAKFSLFHDGFKNLYLQLKANFYDYQLLNTTAKDNSLFYGTAYASGDLKINGFLSNLKMDIKAKSKKGTKLSIPLDGYEEVSRKDYIRFVSLKDSASLSNVKQIDLGGLQLNFNLDVTPDAEFEIIFDMKAGDIIRGKGQGNIKMNIDTEGDFNIFGSYEIQKGKYNFTFANLVNKGFDVQPGSRILFNGDMYESILEIYAAYKKYVSLKPLVNVETLPDPENSEYRRSYPVSALMDLKGKLLSPEIKLGLDLSEAKKTSNSYLQNAVYQLDSRIKGDDQELSRQVFSLLILNKLSPPNAFSGVAGAASNSLSELLSNQFSNWISQVDKNLELSFDIDANNFNSFQMRVSYSLLDGRLRVTRDGGFSNSRNQSDFASVIGDWTVEYLLSPGGKYRIKMYNRSNQNFAGNLNLNNSSTTTAGLSLLHTASFNNLNDLFKSRKKKEAEDKLKTSQEQEERDKQKDNHFVSFEKKDENSKADEKNKDEQDTESLPLKPRYDEIRTQASDKDRKKDTTKNKDNPSKDTQKQPLEGDEDNEPMPERYKKDKKNTDKDKKDATDKEKQNNQLFKHRYDEYKPQKINILKPD